MTSSFWPYPSFLTSGPCSTKLGIWEQWEVEGEEAGEGMPWRRMPLRFRSRRLSGVVLDVEVVRIGYFVSHGMPFSSGGVAESRRQRGKDLVAVSEAGSGVGAENGDDVQKADDLREDEQLGRINSLFVHEWIRWGMDIAVWPHGHPNFHIR